MRMTSFGAIMEKEKILLQLISETDGSLNQISQNLGLADVSDMPDDIALLSLSHGGDENSVNH